MKIRPSRNTRTPDVTNFIVFRTIQAIFRIFRRIGGPCTTSVDAAMISCLDIMCNMSLLEAVFFEIGLDRTAYRGGHLDAPAFVPFGEKSICSVNTASILFLSQSSPENGLEPNDRAWHWKNPLVELFWTFTKVARSQITGLLGRYTEIGLCSALGLCANLESISTVLECLLAHFWLLFQSSRLARNQSNSEIVLRCDSRSNHKSCLAMFYGLFILNSILCFRFGKL
jgi:hypothetical protein